MAEVAIPIILRLFFVDSKLIIPKTNPIIAIIKHNKARSSNPKMKINRRRIILIIPNADDITALFLGLILGC